MATTPIIRPTLPPKFLELPGDPPVPFNIWLGLVNDFFYLTDVTSSAPLPDWQKNIILLSLLGGEGTRQAAAHPAIVSRDKTSHTDFVDAIRSIFATSVPPIRACYEFLNRKQGQAESANDYLLSLRASLPDCGFPTVEENRMLAIAFTLGCRHQPTQEKLLAQPTIDLEEFVRIAKADESARENAAVIRGETQSINKLRSQKKPHAHKPMRQGEKPRYCSGCGSRTHQYKDSSCPAINIQCHFCSSIGHFKKFCKKRQNSSQSAKTVRTAHLVKSISSSSFLCDIKVSTKSSETVTLEMEVDSGSDITAITEKVYRLHFTDFHLSPVRTALSNFDGSKIPHVLGKFTSTVEYEDRQCDLPIYVVKDSCSSILGKNAIQSLSLTLDGSTMKVHSVNNSSRSILTRFPSLTADGIGKVKDFKHTITLAEDAKPIATKLRAVPLSRRDAVNNEINHMVSEGILEKIDKSTWVNPLVTVMEPNGEPRVTTEFSALNKFVVPHRFPLPNAKDLFLELSGAKIYSKLDLKKAYYHVELDPESRPLTATITHAGLFQYTRLPMGLKDSASVFQQLVAHTLADCEGTIAYVDDILVFGSSQEQHDARLERVLGKLADNDFRVNVDKCQFSTPSVTFLGHVITASSQSQETLTRLLTVPFLATRARFRPFSE